MRRILTILFWSVIPAAFIGPGTVTTCMTAGSRYGTSLLWALAISTVACLSLQEASARVAAVTGLDVGQALRRKYPRGRGLVAALVLGAVGVGCAAYQAGNILGAAAGAALRLPVPPSALALAVAGMAALLLATARTATVARLLGAMVAIMGLAFVVTAARIAAGPGAVLDNLLPPAIPAGSSLLVLGLVGTTVVPYNLFLGSGLARGRNLGETRFGLSVAIVLGGVVSVAIVVSGTALTDAGTFEAMSRALESRFGTAGPWLFAVGLFAAGFTSSMTAPLAAAVAARGVLDDGTSDWSDRSLRFRAVWFGVLGFGAAFGVAGFRPIPVILVAQALNGVLLPFVAVSLVLLANDRRLLGDAVAGPVGNAALGASSFATVVLGVQGVLRALTSAGIPDPGEGALYGIALGASAVLAWPVGRAVRRGRHAVR